MTIDTIIIKIIIRETIINNYFCNFKLQIIYINKNLTSISTSILILPSKNKNIFLGCFGFCNVKLQNICL